jgi:hypothetical protein
MSPRTNAGHARDRDHPHLEEWRVEELDADDDGGIALAIFTGPFAEERAYGYAEQLRLRQRRD